MANWLNAQVTARKQWNHRLCSLTLSVELPPFEAGQFINLGLEAEGKMLVRPYSLVNPPDSGKNAEVFFNRVDGGLLSPRLFNLQPGDGVLCGPRAQGFFTLRQVPATESLWLLATGTGLGPFLSMLRTPLPWQQFQRVYLLHSAYDVSERAYLDELTRISEQYGERFAWNHALTRDPGAPLQQRLPALLSSGKLEQWAGTEIRADNSHVMLCGNPGMIRETKAVLEARGLTQHQRFKPGQISIEAY